MPPEIETPTPTPAPELTPTPAPEPQPEPAPEPQPDPAPEPAPEPEPQPEPTEPQPDPLLAALLRDMKPRDPEINPVDELEAPEAPPAAPPEPTPEPTSTPTPAPAPEASKKKKRVTIVDDLDAPAVATPEPTPVAAPTPDPEPIDPDAGYVKGLTDEQREDLTEAEFAERMWPERYRGRRKALIDWFKQADARATTLLQEDPGRKLDDSDEEWSKLLRSKPSLISAHSKRVQREIGGQEAAQKVRQELSPRLGDIERKQQEMDYQPEAKRIVGQFTNGVTELVKSDDKSAVATALAYQTATPTAENGKWRIAGEEFDTQAEAEGYLKQVRESYRLESRIFDEERTRSAALAEEYLMFAKGLRRYDPNNAKHVELLNFINTQGREFAARGGELLRRGGKTFLPREQYVPLVKGNPAEAGKHWTWGDKDVLELLAYEAKARVEGRVAHSIKMAEEFGFQRPKATATRAAAHTKREPQPITPPRAVTRPAKAPADPAPPKPDNSIPVVSTLFRR